MTEDDQYYFRSRAEEELAIAFESSDSASAEIHRSLAKLYLAKVAEPQSRDPSPNVWSTP